MVELNRAVDDEAARTTNRTTSGKRSAAAAKYSAPAAGCAGRILLSLARSQTRPSLAELARDTGSSKSLTYRVIRELEALELVTGGDAGGFQLGPAVLEFSDAVSRLADHDGLPEILKDLSAETGQTVNFGVLRDFDVLITAKQQPAQALVSVTYVGARVPANCSALGKMLLAGLSPEELKRRSPSRLKALTSKSTVDRKTLKAELAEVRSTGVAVDLEGAILGRFAVAVPVQAAWLTEPTGLAVTGSMDDYSPRLLKSLTSSLSAAALRISRLPRPPAQINF